MSTQANIRRRDTTRLRSGRVAIDVDWLPGPEDDMLARLLFELIGEAAIAAMFEERTTIDEGGAKSDPATR